MANDGAGHEPDKDSELRPIPPNALPCTSKRIAHVELFRPKTITSSSSSSNATSNYNGVGADGGGGGKTTTKKKRRPPLKKYHLLFAILYLYQAYWIYSTVGVPYREFLDKAEREGFEVMEGSAKMRAELTHALSDLDDPDRPTRKMGWFDWMDMDIEEQAARKKREKEQSVLDSLPKSMRVPKRYAATFSSMLCSGILVTLHLLVVLLQVWSVRFDVWMNYVSVDGADIDIPEEWMELDEDVNPLLLPVKDADGGGPEGNKGGSEESEVSAKTLMDRIESNNSAISIPKRLPTHAVITPSKRTESPVLVPLLYLPTLGVTMEYHRRRYYLSQETNEWIKIRCNTTMPLPFFKEWNGLSSTEQMSAAGIRFGENKFDVRQPTFLKMYKAQLLSPFTVFQLFCVILWMLDDYWQYSAFTLFMILTFEATVVYSRLRSLGALKGMGNRPRKMMVFREGRWGKVWTNELLPGDILSLTRCVPPKPKKGEEITTVAKKALADSEDGDVVPADVLLLRGSTVVNEASLTGESVPQMKEGMSELVEGEHLDMKTRHKTHVLYAGTKMLQCKGVEMLEEEEASSDEEEKEGDEPFSVSSAAVGHSHVHGDIPNPPDKGCITFVLRTGFSSAQGKLVRMIEGSQEKVKGHEKETALLLLLLFFFAVASSGYVLYHGLHDENRSQYELLLHCILIITSVIPPELPMQMALAVNNSLMTLMKLQIFCTEPYRVPMGGKLDVCLFDKTGTLTTDELVPVGVLGVKTLGMDLGELVTNSSSSKTTAHSSTKNKKGKDDADSKLLTPMTKLPSEAALVLTGCHSLVLIEGETTGDPLESAALRAMRWEVSSKTGRVVPSASTEKKPAGTPFTLPNTNLPSGEIEVLSRHHFSSKLQRMSCVVKDIANRKYFAVVKGSPEMVGTLLSKKPSGYDKSAKFLSRRGYRVISLAYKPLNATTSDVETAKETRSECEAQLTFAGFVAFTCRVRRDTKMVLNKLKEGGMGVTMVTGDALLTAIHVAKEVNICDSDDAEGDGSGTGALPRLLAETNRELEELLESKRAQNATKITSTKKSESEVKPILILEQEISDDQRRMYWQSYDDDSEVASFVATEVPNLAKEYDLAVTGTNIAAAYEYDPNTKSILQHFKVFARMTPDAKETVIECLHSVGKLCLMCGDGANDVGALKQADVGVALLSGFGDVNVDKGEDGNKKKGNKGLNGSSVIAPSDNITVLSPKEREAARLGPVWMLKTKLTALGVDYSKYPELTERDDLFKLYEIKGREKAIQKREQQRKMEDMKRKKLDAKVKQRELVAEKQRKMTLRVKELEEEGVQWAQMKALGEFMAAEKAEGKKRKSDMASKNSVAGSAATIAGQLEDLEMDELPMVKIGDASVAAPFTSKMPSIRSCVDIVRQGRCTLVTSIQMYQILALNCLISAYSLSVLYLDGVKYGDTQMTAMGMLGSISYMSVSRAKPLEKLSSVKPLTSIFHPSLFISLLGQFAVHLVTMIWATNTAKQFLEDDYKVDLDGEFKPGILNSVVFLVSNVQQVTVFVVNLQGRPFMTGLTENRPLLWSLLATFILTFMFASESVPGLNKYFQLVPFPDDDFRNFIIKLLVGDVFICFLFDRAMKLFFCRNILKASVEGTTMKDVMGLARTIAIIMFLMNMFLGNTEQWEELLEEEARLAAEALNSTADEAIGESIVSAVEDAFKSDEF